jgi:Spy/CpxP family protein refolding chaperone
MMRKKMILLVTSVLLLAAGLAVGRLTAQMPGALHARGLPSSWFYDELKLSDEQRTQMDAIWSDMRTKMGQISDSRHALDHQRDAAVRDLLTDSQRTAYDKIFADYHTQRQALEESRQEILHDADDRSRALLDDNQKAKWDELTKEIHERRGPRGSTTQESTTTRPADPASNGG